MIEVQKLMYKCEICGSCYEEKQLAIKCEKRGKQSKNSYPKYYWYHIKKSWDNEEKHVFALKIEDLNLVNCLRNRKYIYEDLISSYGGYDIVEDWDVVEVISVEDMYEKLQILPKLTTYSIEKIDVEFKKKLKLFLEQLIHKEKNYLLAQDKNKLIDLFFDTNYYQKINDIQSLYRNISVNLFLNS